MLWLDVSTVELRVTVAEYEEEEELDTLVETGTLEEEPCDVMLELKVELMLDTVSVVEVIDEVEFRTFVVVVMKWCKYSHQPSQTHNPFPSPNLNCGDHVGEHLQHLLDTTTLDTMQHFVRWS